MSIYRASDSNTLEDTTDISPVGDFGADGFYNGKDVTSRLARGAPPGGLAEGSFSLSPLSYIFRWR